MAHRKDNLLLGCAAAVGAVVLAQAARLLWRKYVAAKGRASDVEDNRKRRMGILKNQSSTVNLDELAESLHSSRSANQAWTTLGLEQPLVIATVGLPARGKSFISQMIIRYLKWTGFECEMFNVGSHRRKIGLQSADSSFFDISNAKAKQVREDMALSVQNDMYIWLHESALKRRVAIFDATNTTKERRKELARRARSENVYLLFVESICDDQNVLRRNYELKLQNDDYKDMPKEKALSDFIQRVVAYEKQYEIIEDTEIDSNISYIKLINVGQKVIARNCSGYLPSKISFFLQNIHINPRKIFLCLTAETLKERAWLSGGSDALTSVDAATLSSGELTPAGQIFSLNIAKFLQSEQETMKDVGKEILVLTGTSREQGESISHLRILFYVHCTTLLNELRAGDLHGLSKAEIKTKYPIEYEMRERDKLNYRYPGSGESYFDVIERLRPIIIELERQRKSVLIVCDLAVLRCITSYFQNTELKDIPFKQFVKHHVYELEIGAFGSTLRDHDLIKCDF